MKKLLLGLLGGLSLGMLFAPEKGKTLRDKIAHSDNKVDEIKNAFLAATQDASQEVKQLINSKDVQDLIGKGKDGIEELKTTMSQKATTLSTDGQVEAKKTIDTLVEKAKKIFAKA